MRERLDKIKQHLRENKKVYIVGGVVFVAGVAVGYLGRDDNAQAVKTFVLGNWKSNITVNNVVEQQLIRRGHPGFRILCKDTGEEFASIRRASECLGISRGELQKHLKGLASEVDGLTLVKLGEMK